MCRFIETIRVVDGVAQHLKYHQDRVNSVSKEVFSSKHIDITTFTENYPLKNRKDVDKFRIVYSKTTINATIELYIPKPVNSLKIIVDNEIDYHLKSENRDRINSLYSQRGSSDNILILKSGEITDTAYSNVVFRLKNRWITPKNPLLKGTAITRLINEGKVEPKVIKLEDLHLFSACRQVNAMLPLDESHDIDIKNISF